MSSTVPVVFCCTSPQNLTVPISLVLRALLWQGATSPVRVSPPGKVYFTTFSFSVSGPAFFYRHQTDRFSVIFPAAGTKSSSILSRFHRSIVSLVLRFHFVYCRLRLLRFEMRCGKRHKSSTATPPEMPVFDSAVDLFRKDSKMPSYLRVVIGHLLEIKDPSSTVLPQKQELVEENGALQALQ